MLKGWILLYVNYINKKEKTHPMDWKKKSLRQDRTWEMSVWGSWHSRKWLTSPGLLVLCYTFPHTAQNWLYYILQNKLSRVSGKIKILPYLRVGNTGGAWEMDKYTRTWMSKWPQVLPNLRPCSFFSAATEQELSGIFPLETALRGLLYWLSKHQMYLLVIVRNQPLCWGCWGGQAGSSCPYWQAQSELWYHVMNGLNKVTSLYSEGGFGFCCLLIGS